MSMRENAAAGLVAILGVLLLWIGFSGRLGVVLGAILCPAQLVKTTPSGDPQPTDINASAVIQGQISAAVANQAAAASGAINQLQLRQLARGANG